MSLHFTSAECSNMQDDFVMTLYKSYISDRKSSHYHYFCGEIDRFQELFPVLVKGVSDWTIERNLTKRFKETDQFITIDEPRFKEAFEYIQGYITRINHRGH